MVQSFTPEYSNELFKFVQEVYSQDIAHYFPKLKLEKLIDLLEHAEYLFESYHNLLKSGQNDEALTAFVIGCFYMFLIVPHSIQFHSRNKSYGIYADLKKYYQEESNMTNVLLMVTNKIDSLLKNEAVDSEASKITRRRAYSVPSRNLEKQLRSLKVADTESTLPELPGEVNSDNESTMWTAPQLDPNDQLKLALAPAMSPSSSISSAINEQSSKKSADPSLSSSSDEQEPPLSKGKVESRTRHGSVPASYKPSDENTALSSPFNIYSQDVDRFVTHRKDSYHSVYMMNEDYDDDLVFNLTRLQKQSVMTCDQLMDILKSSERYDLLLIDLRLAKRFKHNHIVSPKVLNIDPRILWNENAHVPLHSDNQLEALLSDPSFHERTKYKHIVYYTDMATFLHVDFDYQLVFFQLLYTSSKSLPSVPKVLLGGYEQWKKYISSYASSHNIDRNDYLYRPYTTGKKAQSPPVPKKSPPAVPLPVTTPPPIPPTTSPPAVPMKVVIEENYNRMPMPLPAKPNSSSVYALPPAHQHRHPKGGKYHSSRQHAATEASKFHVSIPTIEQNPNAYVALSITGLRNLGNTCYINSMLQCLFATRSFRDIFLSSKYQEYLSDDYHKPNQLSKSFHMLFKKMYMNGGCSVVPTGFLKACNALRPDFKIPNDQQDTQEFLLFLLSQLHDELSNADHVASDYPELILHDDEKLQVDHKEYNNWFEDNVMKNGISPVDDIFQGQMENSLQCERCGYCTYNYSIFYVLSLAIPSHSTTFGKGKKVKLEDCINLFTSDEELTGENAWDCPKCGSAASGSGPEGDKKRKRRFLLSSDHPSSNRSKFFKLHSKPRSRSASPFGRLNSLANSPEKWKSKKLSTIKTLNFITLPPVLTIHLSRFYYDLTKKNNTVVTYPLVLSIVLKNDQVVNYRLYAIVNHFGNLISGHYTSLVNKDLQHEVRHGKQKWYYFDDEVVKRDNNHGDFDAGITGISSSDVYVLFYEKIDE